MVQYLRRRDLLRAAVAGAALGIAAVVPGAKALDLAADDGSPIRNRSVDLRRLLDALTVAQRVGSPDADVTVVEFFDYNCGYCRAAVEGLESVVRNDPRLSLLLVHTPILAPGSLEAAVLQQAVYRRYGATRAYDLHLALYRMRGLVDGARARSAVDPAFLDGLTADDFGAAADEVAQMRRVAAEVGVRAVPTFVTGKTLFIGWPGRTALAAMVESARRCGQALCG